MSQHSQVMHEPTNCQADDSHRACVRCKVVSDSMEKHGFGDIAVDLQRLYDEVMKIERIDQAKKSDMGEVIASIMKQLGHTGRIERIVLKVFDKQMTEFLHDHADVLKAWKCIKDNYDTLGSG